MKTITVALVLARSLAIAGAILVLVGATQPWMTVQITNADASREPGASINQMLPREINLHFSAVDLTTVATGHLTLAPQIGSALGRLNKLSFMPGEQTILQMTVSQLTAHRNVAIGLTCIAVVLWQLPVVALTLAVVLLVSNGNIRFRRGFGAFIALTGLLVLAALIVIRARIDSMMSLLNSYAGIRTLLESLEDSGVRVWIRSTPMLLQTMAPALALLAGGLLELWLTVRRTSTAVAGTPLPPTLFAPALQPVMADTFETVAAGVGGMANGHACTGCGSHIAPGARFCRECGTPA